MSHCKIRSIRFNQDMSCFICGTEDGVRVFNVEPLAQMLHLHSDVVGQVLTVDMFERSNIIALVNETSDCHYPENVLRIFEMQAKKFLAYMTFGDRVLEIRLCRDRLVAVLLTKIIVFEYPNLRRLATFDTRSNPSGLCQVSHSSVRSVMVFPGLGIVGSAHITDIGRSLIGNSAPERFGERDASPMTYNGATQSPAAVCVPAHKHELACLAVSTDGTRFATASTHGTLLRLFDAATGVRLLELRRGADQAAIHCITFSLSSRYLCVSSDKETVHIYAVGESNVCHNQRSAVVDFARAILGGGLVGNCSWSMVKFTVPSRCMCAFDSEGKSSVFAVCFDGTLHQYVFDMASGHGKMASFDKFIEHGDNSEI